MPDNVLPRNMTQILRQAAIDGDLGSFVELSRPLLGKLYAYAYYMVGSRSGADQIIARGLRRAWTNIRDLGDQALEMYLFRCVRLEVHDWLKKYSLHVRRGPNENLRRFEDGSPTDLTAAICVLSGEEREVFLLAAMLGYGPTIVEQITGDPVVVLRARLRRACLKMSRILTPNSEQDSHPGSYAAVR